MGPMHVGVLYLRILYLGPHAMEDRVRGRKRIGGGVKPGSRGWCSWFCLHQYVADHYKVMVVNVGV